MNRAERLDVNDVATARQILEVQRASYAVEAQIIGSDAIPALHETLEELRNSGECWIGIRDEEGLVGGVAHERDEKGVLDIVKLVVAPRAFRRGLATALLDALDAAEPAVHTTVSTGAANIPALALYKKRGFVAIRDLEVAPGLMITQLERHSQ